MEGIKHQVKLPLLHIFSVFFCRYILGVAPSQQQWPNQGIHLWELTHPLPKTLLSRCIFIFQRCGYLPLIPQVKGYLLYSHLSNVQTPYDIPSSRLVSGILILLHYSPCMQYLGRISCFHPLSKANIKGQLGVTRNSVPMVIIVF